MNWYERAEKFCIETLKMHSDGYDSENEKAVQGLSHALAGLMEEAYEEGKAAGGGGGPPGMPADAGMGVTIRMTLADAGRIGMFDKLLKEGFQPEEDNNG